MRWTPRDPPPSGRRRSRSAPTTRRSGIPIGTLLATYRRVARDGTTPRARDRARPDRLVPYADPDGNRVELQIDVFDSGTATDWTSGAVFTADPIGVGFAPEEMIERYERGVTLQELTQHPDHPDGDGGRTARDRPTIRGSASHGSRLGHEEIARMLTGSENDTTPTILIVSA